MRVKQCNRVFPRFVLGALLKLRRLIRRQPDRVFLAIQPDAAAERQRTAVKRRKLLVNPLCTLGWKYQWGKALNAVNCSSIRCAARIT